MKDAVEKVKEALKGEDTEAVKSALAELNEKSQAMASALRQPVRSPADGSTEAGKAGQSGQSGPVDDDVVDAEIVDEDENK